jgi:asparagine synthase (glutamine-hydrolysing)
VCGICGIVDYREPVPRETLLAMRDIMAHRGPDDAGLYRGEFAGLGHRRLMIIDLSPAARQPMPNEDRSLWIAYNGEIYNFKELREELVRKGHQFISQSDTEVILHGFEAWGLPDLLQRLNGIFAFAIWDEKNRKLVAARDHLGVKPFYYTCSGGRFLFASEIKALLAGGLPFRLDHALIEEQMIFRHVAGAQTLVRDAARLLPGHYLEFDRKGLRLNPYWSPLQAYQASAGPSSPEEVKDRLEKAAAMQLISDVPVGVLCSGGIDSSILTALTSHHIRDLNTFCVSFQEKGFDDAPYAWKVSSRYKTRHHELVIEAEAYLEQLMEAVWANDEPLAHGHEAQILNIARMAKPFVTVLLSGEGADELFGGYRRFELVNRHAWIAFPGSRTLGRLLRPVVRATGNRRLEKFMAFMGHTLPEALLYNPSGVLRAHLDRLRWEFQGRFAYRTQAIEKVLETGLRGAPAAMMADQMLFLPSLLDRNDKMTMFASIECRVPFLDVPLVELANRLPKAWRRHRNIGKRVLRSQFGHLLPPAILERSKLGFGVPMDDWFRTSPSLKSALRGLEACELVKSGVLEKEGVRSLVNSHLRGEANLSSILWTLLALQLWIQEIPRRLTEELRIAANKNGMKRDPRYEPGA